MDRCECWDKNDDGELYITLYGLCLYCWDKFERELYAARDASQSSVIPNA